MFHPPPNLSDGDVAAALSRYWGFHPTALRYHPAGFGSHHWVADAAGQRWFVTVDDCEGKREAPAESVDAFYARLRAAIGTAFALSAAGLEFVVAPVASLHGEPLARLSPDFAMAVYPYLDHDPPGYGEYSAAERSDVLQLLIELHGAEPGRMPADTDTFDLGNRAPLLAAIREVAIVWAGGHYAEPARALLAAHVEGVRSLLGQYDAWASDARGRARVITHGEPHHGNTFAVGSRRVLVDWDTALIAPPERDLWMIAETPGPLTEAYAAATGYAPEGQMLDFYRLRWDLAEIGVYIAEFRRRHSDNANTRESWKNLNHYLDPAGRWPQLM